MAPTGAPQNTVVAWLADHGADDLPHFHGTLLDHLQRVEGLVREWGGTDALAMAGLCHATYGTDGFAPSLLHIRERSQLVDLVGADVEAVVYRYASCDRRASYPALADGRLEGFVDRFTTQTVSLSPGEAADFCDLTLANECDVALGGDFDAGMAEWYSGLVAQLGGCCSPGFRHGSAAALATLPG